MDAPRSSTSFGDALILSRVRVPRSSMSAEQIAGGSAEFRRFPARAAQRADGDGGHRQRMVFAHDDAHAVGSFQLEFEDRALLGQQRWPSRRSDRLLEAPSVRHLQPRRFPPWPRRRPWAQPPARPRAFTSSRCGSMTATFNCDRASKYCFATRGRHLRR